MKKSKRNRRKRRRGEEAGLERQRRNRKAIAEQLTARAEKNGLISLFQSKFRC